MSNYLKLSLIIIALAYLISPVDLIPDLYIPFIGWIDDAFLIGMILYYLRFGRLPFFQRKGKPHHPTGKERRETGRSEDFTMNRRAHPNAGTDNHGQPPPGPSSTRTEKTPHEILDIDRDATREEIQTAYRKAAKQYHPDRVAHLGKELQELANKKFIEIKKARNAMMNLR